MTIVTPRRIIQISDSMALCADGTLWKIKGRITIGDLRDGVTPWEAVENVPQDENAHSNCLKQQLRDSKF